MRRYYNSGIMYFGTSVYIAERILWIFIEEL